MSNNLEYVLVYAMGSRMVFFSLVLLPGTSVAFLFVPALPSSLVSLASSVCFSPLPLSSLPLLLFSPSPSPLHLSLIYYIH